MTEGKQQATAAARAKTSEQEDWVNGSFWVKDLNSKGLKSIESNIIGAFIFNGLNKPIEDYPAEDPSRAPSVLEALAWRAWANHLASCPISEERRQVFVEKIKTAITALETHRNSSMMHPNPFSNDYYLFDRLEWTGFLVPALGLTEKDGIDFSTIKHFLAHCQLEEGGWPYPANTGEPWTCEPHLSSTGIAVHSLLLLGEDNQTLLDRCVDFVLSLHTPNSSIFHTTPEGGSYDFETTVNALSVLVPLGAEVPDRSFIIEKALEYCASEQQLRRSIGMSALVLLEEFALLESLDLVEKQRDYYREQEISTSFVATGALKKTSYWALWGVAPSDFDFRLSPSKLPLNKSVRVTLEITNRHPRPRVLKLVGLEPVAGGGSFEVQDFPVIAGEEFAGNERRLVEFALKKTSPGNLTVNLVTRREVLLWRYQSVRECDCSTVFQLGEEAEEQDPSADHSPLIVVGAVLGGLLVVGSTTAAAIFRH